MSEPLKTETDIPVVSPPPRPGNYPKPRFYFILATVAALSSGYYFRSSSKDEMPIVDGTTLQNHTHTSVEDDELPTTEEAPPKPSYLVSIISTSQNVLVAKRMDDKIEVRSGGNDTWRNNNPGKIVYGDYAKLSGAVGTDGISAIFPTYEAGKKALEDYLFTDIATDINNKTIENAILAEKLDQLLKESGLQKELVLGSLDNSQKEKIIAAIQKIEGFLTGSVSIFENDAAYAKSGAKN